MKGIGGSSNLPGAILKILKMEEKIESMARLDLLILRSENIKRLKEFYSSLLMTKFEKHADHGPAHYGAILGEVLIELYPTKKRISNLDSPGFKVGNIDEVIQRVGNQCVYREPYQNSYGKFAMLKDPDGRLVHLTETPVGNNVYKSCTLP